MQLLLQNQRSERLYFRLFVPEDEINWVPFFENPKSTEFWEGLPDDPALSTKNHFKAIFERYNKQLGGMNALIHQQTDKLIGMCGLLIQEVDGQKELEIGYSILPEYWQNGYASEAAKKCLDFVTENQLAISVISIIHIANIPSQKVAKSMGMQLSKTTTHKGYPVHIFRKQITPQNA